jgi:hypothetical protein
MTDSTTKPVRLIPDWMQDMAKIPFSGNAEREGQRFVASGPAPMMPPQDSNRVSNPPGSGSGWQHQAELGPQPGIDLIDRMVINAEAQERKQRAPGDFLSKVMECALLIIKSQKDEIESLTQRVEALEAKAPQPKRPKADPKASTGGKQP